MAAGRSTVRACSHRIPGGRLAAARIGVALSLFLLQGQASPGEAGRSPSPAAPPGIRQELIVEAEVDVRTEEELALLRSRGYECAGSGYRDTRDFLTSWVTQDYVSSRSRYPTPGSVMMWQGRSGSCSILRRRFEMLTRSRCVSRS